MKTYNGISISQTQDDLYKELTDMVLKLAGIVAKQKSLISHYERQFWGMDSAFHPGAERANGCACACTDRLQPVRTWDGREPVRTGDGNTTTPDSQITADPALNKAARDFMEEHPNVDAVNMEWIVSTDGNATPQTSHSVGIDYTFIGDNSAVYPLLRDTLCRHARRVFKGCPPGASILITRHAEPGVIHLTYYAPDDTFHNARDCGDDCSDCDTTPDSQITADPELNLAARVFMEENPNVEAVNLEIKYKEYQGEMYQDVQADCSFIGVDEDIDRETLDGLKDSTLLALRNYPYAQAGASLLITRDAEPGVIHLTYTPPPVCTDGAVGFRILKAVVNGLNAGTYPYPWDIQEVDKTECLVIKPSECLAWANASSDMSKKPLTSVREFKALLNEAGMIRKEIHPYITVPGQGYERQVIRYQYHIAIPVAELQRYDLYPPEKPDDTFHNAHGCAGECAST